MIFSKKYKNKIKVLTNPIDDIFIKKSAIEDINTKEYDLIFCARFVYQKNPERFIRIVKELKNHNKNIKCIMLGEGPLLNKCKNLIKKLLLEDNIILKGFVENPYRYMNKAKILCLTSRWEGLGLVALEANILSVPVFTTNATGVQEIYGKNSYFYCKSNKEFSEKIINALNNSDILEKLSASAIKIAEPFCNKNSYINNIRGIYRKL